MQLTVNGKTLTVDAPGDMPLLWVLRDVVGMTGTKYGCGIAACGACTVHLDGQPIRSCMTPVSSVAGKSVTTIEAKVHLPELVSGGLHLEQLRVRPAQRLAPRALPLLRFTDTTRDPAQGWLQPSPGKVALWLSSW